MSLPVSPSSQSRRSSTDRFATAVMLDQQLQQRAKRKEDAWASGMVSVEQSLDEKTAADIEKLLSELKPNSSGSVGSSKQQQQQQQQPRQLQNAESETRAAETPSPLLERLPSYLRDTRAAKRSSHVSAVVSDFASDHPQIAGILNSVSSIYEEVIAMLIDDIDRKDRIAEQHQDSSGSRRTSSDVSKTDPEEREERRGSSASTTSSQSPELLKLREENEDLRRRLELLTGMHGGELDPASIALAQPMPAKGGHEQQLNSLFSIHPNGALQSMSQLPTGLGNISMSNGGWAASISKYHQSVSAFSGSVSVKSNVSSNSNSSQVRDRSIAKMQRETRKVMLSAVKIEFKLGNVIGTGTHGVVYLALLENTGETVAAKEISFSLHDPQWERRLNNLQKEIGVLKKIEHEHIVQYLFAERRTDKKSNPSILIFMEYVSGGSISSIVRQFGALHESTVAIFAAQITLALRHLHRNGIVHRDIKPANCLLSPFGIVKVADFGTALTEDDTVSDEEVPLSLVGTPYFMAPEIIRQEAYGAPVDVWSLGCTVMEMLTGTAPWAHLGLKTPTAVLHFVAKQTDEVIELPKSISAEAADFLQKCLQRDPARRPTMHDLLRHRWFNQHDVLMLSYDMNDLQLRPESVENIGMQIASTSSISSIPLPPRSRNNSEPRAGMSLSDRPFERNYGKSPTH